MEIKQNLKKQITDLTESKLTCGNILKPLPTIAGGNLPTFVVMIPQESGIRAGGSINKKLTQKTQAIFIKNPIEES